MMLKNLSLISIMMVILSVAACSKGGGQNEQNNQDDTNPPTTGSYVLANSTVSVSAAVVPSGERIEVKLTAKDQNDNIVVSDSLDVRFYIPEDEKTSTGLLTDTTNNGDGTYSAFFTGLKAGDPVNIYASINDEDLANGAPALTVIPGAPVTLSIEDANGKLIDYNEVIADGKPVELVAKAKDFGNNDLGETEVTWEQADSTDLGRFSQTVGSKTVFYPPIANTETSFVATATKAKLAAKKTDKMNVVWKDLTLAINFDGNTSDRAGNVSDVENVGGSFSDGVMGQALSLNTENSSKKVVEYVQVKDSQKLNVVDSGTLAVWVNADKKENNYGGIIAQGDESNFLDGSYMLQLLPHGRIILYVLSAPELPAQYAVTSTGVITPGEWNHIVGTWDASTLNIYINGKLAAQAENKAPALKSSGSVYIGAQTRDTINRFQGLIDSLQVWNTALAQSDLLRIYGDKINAEIERVKALNVVLTKNQVVSEYKEGVDSLAKETVDVVVPTELVTQTSTVVAQASEVVAPASESVTGLDKTLVDVTRIIQNIEQTRTTAYYESVNQEVVKEKENVVGSLAKLEDKYTPVNAELSDANVKVGEYRDNLVKAKSEIETLKQQKAEIEASLSEEEVVLAQTELSEISSEISKLESGMVTAINTVVEFTENELKPTIEEFRVNKQNLDYAKTDLEKVGNKAIALNKNVLTESKGKVEVAKTVVDNLENNLSKSKESLGSISVNLEKVKTSVSSVEVPKAETLFKKVLDKKSQFAIRQI